MLRGREIMVISLLSVAGSEVILLSIDNIFNELLVNWSL